MDVTLSPETEAYIEKSVRNGAFTSPSEFIEAAARRQMQEEASFEQEVLKGMNSPATPLRKEDLESVREIVRKARAR